MQQLKVNLLLVELALCVRERKLASWKKDQKKKCKLKQREKHGGEGGSTCWTRAGQRHRRPLGDRWDKRATDQETHRLFMLRTPASSKLHVRPLLFYCYLNQSIYCCKTP